MPTNIATSCMRCGKCCTSFGVCVTIFDIARIVEATGMKPSTFVQLVPEPPERERREPAVLIDTSYWLVVLKWKKKFNCIFYEQVPGKTHGKDGCKIYSFRPMLCRTYPFCLKEKRLGDMKSRACPEKWAPMSKEKSEYLSDLKKYQKEVHEYAKIVKQWNKSGGGSFDSFLKYASGFLFILSDSNTK